MFNEQGYPFNAPILIEITADKNGKIADAIANFRDECLVHSCTADKISFRISAQLAQRCK